MGIGQNNRNVYMLDYGLARQYVTQTGEGKWLKYQINCTLSAL